MRGLLRRGLQLLFCLLPVACRGPEVAPDVDPRVEEWLSLIPADWRMRREAEFDPALIEEFTRLTEALPAIPEVELRLSESFARRKDLPLVEIEETDPLDLIDPQSPLEPTEEGWRTLRDWSTTVLGQTNALRNSHEQLRNGPRVRHRSLQDIEPKWFGSPGFFEISALATLGVSGEPLTPLAEAWLSFQDNLDRCREETSQTVLDALLTQAARARYRRALVPVLPRAPEPLLERWIRSRTADRGELYSTIVRGELTLAVVPSIAWMLPRSKDEREDPARRFTFPEEFDQLLSKHPNPLDVPDTIAKLIEVAEQFERSIEEGATTPPEPPPWLAEVLDLWPEEAGLSTFLPYQPGWETRGELSLRAARKRLRSIANPAGKLLAAQPARLFAELERRAKPEAARDVTFRAAAAATLFERRTGHFPESWEPVVAAGLLDTVPIDPYGGAPLDLDPHHRCVRSIGEDLAPGPLPPPRDLSWWLADENDGGEFIVDPEGNRLPDDTSTDDIVIEIGPLAPLPSRD